MQRTSRWLVGVALVGLLAGCASGPSATSAGSSPTASAGSTPTSTRGDSGLRTCPLGSLPGEADETVTLIRRGGPFPFPRNDGVVFGNRERVLPAEHSGYYHEYTVITPGSRTRGARRIVTGGKPLTDPAVWFYTGDHYDSFCEITGAER
ncbi:guanyl-specific ribonuclease Sa [Friedmanniella endophytica]|uniref:Guanyl-specific ribonuclease Sa n=1 Tax=Microlunatus kandeliicorticis TaxID=1759536 RepID=A0A7W3IQN9_9ACTN|nr:ribonuclease domain-containing protein [Microlunatus kandeliicorticis]MBA8793481.1 guanyl-specific ribonuclease Sa [Microlunatus kandeliicorticis]